MEDALGLIGSVLASAIRYATPLVLAALGGWLISRGYGFWYDELFTAEMAPLSLRRLAEAVAERWPGAAAPPETVRTNVVTFAHPHPAAVLDHLRSEGVLGGTIAPGVVRLVTHNDVDDAGVERAAKALATSP